MGVLSFSCVAKIFLAFVRCSSILSGFNKVCSLGVTSLISDKIEESCCEFIFVVGSCIVSLLFRMSLGAFNVPILVPQL